jgi:hypothetical protein
MLKTTNYNLYSTIIFDQIISSPAQYSKPLRIGSYRYSKKRQLEILLEKSSNQNIRIDIKSSIEIINKKEETITKKEITLD